jgi:hypothetical protein
LLGFAWAVMLGAMRSRGYTFGVIDESIFSFDA